MDFKKIEKEIYKKGFTKKEFFERTRIMTEQGFHYTVSKGKLKVTDLEAITRELGIPMSTWWEDEPKEGEKELEEVKRELARVRDQLRAALKVQEAMANQMERMGKKRGKN